MLPEDLLRQHHLEDAVLSPDGLWVAAVVHRPRKPGEYFRRDLLGGNDRADIWLAKTDGTQTWNLTHGEQEHAGYWSPVWSPDSSRLAVLSTRGNDNIRAFVWDRKTATLQQVTTEGIDIAAKIHLDGNKHAPIAWLDADRLLTITLPAGHAPLWFDEEQRTSAIEFAAEEATMRGTRVTASVIASPDVHPEPVSGTLSTIEVESGQETKIANIPITEMRLSQRVLSISPDRKWVTIVAPGLSKPVQPDRAMRLSDFYPMQIWIGCLQGSIPLRSMDRLVPANGGKGFNNIVVQWSPDSSRFAVLVETSTVHSDSLAGVAVIEPDTAMIHMLALNEDGDSRVKTARYLRWSEQGHLLVLAQATKPIAQTTSYRWNARDPAISPNFDIEDQPRWWLWENDQTKRLLSESEVASAIPTISAKPVSITRDSRVTVIAGDGNGTNSREILSFNRDMDDVAPGEFRNIAYETADGKEWGASLLLPFGYKEGTRFPLVVDVYGGAVYRNLNGVSNARYTPYDGSFLNLLLLAARGYGVLTPSIPLQPEGIPSDPLLDLDYGIAPAIAKVVELGFADPQRLAVMGHSYGGYSTYSLITQTQRFRAAIAMAGFVDLFSLYGRFDRRYRYSPYASAATHCPAYLENAQGRIGAPPWVDPERYLRNSPLLHVDRVQTPLLIIHGSLDMLEISQAEEFFSALTRLGKPVEFVRYIGEGHAIDSPANIVDMWNRIYNFLDNAL